MKKINFVSKFMKIHEFCAHGSKKLMSAVDERSFAHEQRSS